MSDARVSAMLQEVAEQRVVLGNRAVNHAGTIAELLTEIDALKKRIAELEKPKES